MFIARKRNPAHRFLAPFLSFALIAHALHAQDCTPTDIVFMIDTSGSMRTALEGTTRFAAVQERLAGYIAQRVSPGSTIGLVTFGDRAELLALREVHGPEDIQFLVAKVRSMRCGSAHTHIAAGLNLGAGQLLALKRRFPDHSRLGVLLTDGRNEPPPPLPPDSHQVTFDDIRHRFAHGEGFEAGRDWLFWYCFLNNTPDSELNTLARDLNGVAQPVRGNWSLSKLCVSRALARLEDVPIEGEWRREFPSPQDRALGEKLTFEFSGAEGAQLRLRGVVFDTLPGGVRSDSLKVTVKPNTIALREGRIEQVLTLEGATPIPGDYAGRIIFEAPPGQMLVVSPQQLKVAFRVLPARRIRLTARPATTIQLSVRPGKAAEAPIYLVPSEPISEIDTALLAKITGEFPPWLHVRISPTRLVVNQDTTLRLSAQIDGAEVKGGTFSGQIQLSASDARIELEPAILHFVVDVSQALVAVSPPRLDFGPIRPDQEKVASLTLKPDDLAKNLGFALSLDSRGIPAGAELKIEPSRWTPNAGEVVKLTLKLPAGAVLSPRDYAGEIVLIPDRPDVRLSANRIPFTVRVTISWWARNGRWVSFAVASGMVALLGLVRATLPSPVGKLVAIQGGGRDYVLSRFSDWILRNRVCLGRSARLRLPGADLLPTHLRFITSGRGRSRRMRVQVVGSATAEIDDAVLSRNGCGEKDLRDGSVLKLGHYVFQYKTNHQ